MNMLKKILAALMLLCLLMNTIPAALAVDDSSRLSARVDMSELQRQVAIANGLNSYDYTYQTWNPLKEALKSGNAILKGSHGQYVVTKTAEDIANAMAGLVRMNYSQLETTLGVVYNKIDENPQLHDVWQRLNAAVDKARPLLVSGDQEAVDASVEELNALLAELAECAVTVDGEPQVVVQEVEVEVLPTDDYCNIPMHRTWPVLFVISAVLNVALIVVLTYVIMKKRNTVDNTPLVSYDIDDDMDY